MSELSPQVASALADGVYDLVSGNEHLLNFFLNRPEFSGNPNTSQTLTADVGFRIVDVKDVFGFCAEGGQNYQQDAFIIFRGSTSLAADWMTNFRLRLHRGQHIGFKTAFESMLPQIDSFLSGLKPGVTVQCIGHSLGGAVATIAAQWIAKNKANEVKLYTFGAPKPGTYFFAKQLTTDLNEKNIFRVYHPTDPVPMAPIFPFVHPPAPGFGHLLQSNEGLIGSASHDMALYVGNLSTKSWDSLDKTAPPYALEHIVKLFLESKTPVNANTPKIWEWINAGLIYVLTKISGNIINLLSTGLMGVMTIADTISYILIKGYELGRGLLVNLLVTKIQQALGLPTLVDAVDLTHDFLANIMRQIMQRTNKEAQKAITAT
ncbi:hypothetical protein MNBD_GAMMA07-677 [hydrothermal vent metagenome]|uniref:Fungal lipase-type domain-containing protein n=1 Tax=hydrothermal vent metagenome TaxID=652676 RepID=A0A3B0X8B1_9ZZZZ